MSAYTYVSLGDPLDPCATSEPQICEDFVLTNSSSSNSTSWALLRVPSVCFERMDMADDLRVYQIYLVMTAVSLLFTISFLSLCYILNRSGRLSAKVLDDDPALQVEEVGV